MQLQTLVSMAQTIWTKKEYLDSHFLLKFVYQNICCRVQEKDELRERIGQQARQIRFHQNFHFMDFLRARTPNTAGAKAGRIILNLVNKKALSLGG